MRSRKPSWPARLPFYYGWVIIAIAFVTMAIGVTVRTSFSLLLPPLTTEFGWDRGQIAGAFSFGFLASAMTAPLSGRLMDRFGPRPIVLTGVCLISAGLFCAPWIQQPWQLYVTLGMLVGCGANLTSYSAQSLYLPNWFVRRRGLAIGVAFSGVGIGAIVLLPWLQTIIVEQGWRATCRTLGLLTLVVMGPLNLFIWHRPADVGLSPDGLPPLANGAAGRPGSVIIDHAWAGTTWTAARALRTGRFWWLGLGYGCSLYAWYAVQVHQTKYLTEIGFSPITAAWALGLVSLVGIPGQIGLGALSDRVGRELIWAAGCFGFAVCYAALIVMEHTPSPVLLYVMVFSQGFLGYALTSVMGPIIAEVFEGPHYGSIFGMITLAMISGGALGPWLTGFIHDATGSYRLAFMLAIGCCVLSAVSVWIAGPRRVRMVPGRRAPA
jgi:MFS family permease